MTRSIVLTNHKGGVGKSTSATNIALGLVHVLRHLKATNSRVLLIDTDSQGHASLVTTGRNDFGTDNSLYTVLMADRREAPNVLSECIVQSQWDTDLHVLPASPLLEGAERELTGTAGAPYRLADPLSKIAPHYAAIVIDTRPSFSLMTEMGLLAATDAIVPVEPRYLETVGLLSVINKINDIREGWRHPNLRVSGILVTKMDSRIKGHNQLLDELKGHSVLGQLLCGVIPQNEAVSYSHHNHLSIFNYDPKAAASTAYAELVSTLVRQMARRKAVWHMARKKREINTSLLDSVTADMLGGDEVDFLHDDSLRVERILLELVRPDPLQPRRVLPDRIYQAFHAGQMTPTQALRDLTQVAQLAARQHGRPFANVLDLMGNPDDENSDDLPPLSAEEQLVRDLTNLAITIRDDGQVNPLTVVDVTQGVTRQYCIETGERRYWATWILRDFIPGYESDGMIPCIVIPAESASAFRQAKENTARSGLSAIVMARQVALLLLQIHGYPMPDGAVTNDFYRQSLDLDLRGKREYTTLVLSALGGIHKRQLSRYKSLLRLCDEALELADRHNLEESHLRLILHLEPEDQVEVLRQCIAFNLTRKQLHDLLEKAPDDGDEREEKPPKQVLQLARLMRDGNMPDPSDVARALINQEGNANIARARLQTLRQVLSDAERYLED